MNEPQSLLENIPREIWSTIDHYHLPRTITATDPVTALGPKQDLLGGLWADSKRNVYFSVSNQGIMVLSKGEISPFWSATGLGSESENVFTCACCVWMDPKEKTMYVAGSNGIARMAVPPAGQPTLFAGHGDDGLINGELSASRFCSPTECCFDDVDGSLIICDTSNRVIRRISRDGVVSTLAGGGRHEHRDGCGADASFIWPVGIAYWQDTYYVSDKECIKSITRDGQVDTIYTASNCDANSLCVDFQGNFILSNTDDPGVTIVSKPQYTWGIAGPCYTEERISFESSPYGVRMDPDGNVLVVADALYKISPEQTGLPSQQFALVLKSPEVV